MDSQGNVRCGMHGKAWCPECSKVEEEAARKRVGLPPADEDRQRIQAELESIGLGKKRRKP